MFEFITKLNQNPIYIKEQYVQKHREEKRNYLFYPFLFFIAFYLLPTIITVALRWKYDGEIEGFAKCLFSLVIVMIGLYFSYKSASIAMVLICRERENRTFTALLGTMMTSADIFMGNFWIAFTPAARELTYIFPSVLINGYLLKFNLIALSFTYIFILIFIALFAIIGVYCSSDSNSLWEARDKTTGIMLYLFLGFTGITLLVTTISLYFIPITGWITVPALFIISTFNPLVNMATLACLTVGISEMPSLMIPAAIGHLILGAVVYRIIAGHFYRKAVE